MGVYPNGRLIGRDSGHSGARWVSMDRELLERQLAEAEQRIAYDKLNVAGQLEWVQRLEHDGRDAGDAKKLLAVFENGLARDVVDHDRLLRELGTSLGH